MAAVFVDVPFDSIGSLDAVDLISFDFGMLATNWPLSSSAVLIAAHRSADQLTVIRLAAGVTLHAANVSGHPVAVTTDSDTDLRDEKKKRKFKQRKLLILCVPCKHIFASNDSTLMPMPMSYLMYSSISTDMVFVLTAEHPHAIFICVVLISTRILNSKARANTA